MQCKQVKKRLSALADHELTIDEEQAVAQHLANCPDCRTMAQTEEKLALALDSLGPVRAPRDFSKKVLRMARNSQQPVDLNLWWQHLSLAWRGVVCTTALAGLLCGAVLGTSLPSGTDDSARSGPLVFLGSPDDGGLY